MTAINHKFSYFLALPVAEEDLRQYLHDPVEALPPAVSDLLPNLGIVLAPFLERGSTRTNVSVVYEKPPEPKLVFSTRVETADFATLFFTIKDEQVSDYHYYLYDELAALISNHCPAKVQDTWHGLLREELSAEVHGEVDEKSWHLKQTLLRRPMAARKDGKPFRAYALRYRRGDRSAATAQPPSAEKAGSVEEPVPAAGRPCGFPGRRESSPALRWVARTSVCEVRAPVSFVTVALPLRIGP
jgi:hypothetical protein